MAEKTGNKTDGDAVSQDEIDKLLLNASEESVAQDVLPHHHESDTDDIITLEDIDRLIDIALETDIDIEDDTEEPPPADNSSIIDDSGAVSNDEIDNLINAGKDQPDPEVNEAISQDDIDQMMVPEKDETETDNSESEKSESEVVSQDDIDSLLNGDTAEDTSDNDGAEAVSQDDIDDLLQGETQETSPDETTKKERSNLIDQDELDRLLKKFEEKTNQKTLDEKPTEEPEDTDEDTVLISQDEINKLIGIVDDEESVSEETDEDKSVSEEISEDTKAETKGQDEDVLLQSDLDQLLKISDEEDDDDEALGEITDVEDSDKVLLEADKEEDAPEEETKKKWYKTWYVAAGAASFLIISFASIFLYIYLQPGVDKETKTGLTAFSLETQKQEIIDPLAANTDNLIDLKGFVVMAPIDRKDITCITTNVFVTLKDDVSADLIRKNKSFFRGVIYNTVIKALEPNAQEKSVNKLILTSGIKIALNKALPEASVQQVILNDLNLI